MGETSTNIAMLNMDDALKVRVKDGCDVGDPCASSPCPQHSQCRDTWDSYLCVCDKGERPPPIPRPDGPAPPPMPRPRRPCAHPRAAPLVSAAQ